MSLLDRLLGASMMTRSVIRYVVAVSLVVLFAGNALADMPPLLKAKGKQQQCDSLEVWTKIAQELNTAAFADSVFKPLIGKSYRDLSNSEKKKILEIVDRCMVNTGKNNYLPLAFETGSRTDLSTDPARRARQHAYLENVTELDVRNAREVVEFREKYQRQLIESTPQLIAHSFPGDPKAIKRQRLKKRMCFASTSGWHFLFNDYVFDGEAVIASNDGHRGRGIRPCGNAMAMQLFLPNVSSLLRMPNPPYHTLLSVGDICGKDPEILFLYPSIRAMPKYGEYPRNNREGQYSPDFGTVQYQIYVPSGSDGVVHRGIINQVESGILAAREIVLKQCKTVPDSIRVVGGTLHKGGLKPKNRSRELPKKLDYWEFYSGTFYPNEPEKRLVHDDQRMAANYSAMAVEYAAYIRAGQEEAANASDGSLALGFLLLVLAAQYAADPCNNTDIPYTDRVAAGCFN